MWSDIDYMDSVSDKNDHFCWLQSCLYSTKISRSTQSIFQLTEWSHLLTSYTRMDNDMVWYDSGIMVHVYGVKYVLLVDFML